jgi:CBS domain containing-hemolysin-like protein
MSPQIALLVSLVLLAANGFFVAAEFSLLAARRSRIEQLAAEGDRRARHAAAGIRELPLMLAGAQLGITICSLGLGAVAEPAVSHLIEGGLGDAVGLPDTATHAIGLAIALTIVVFLHMVVGEMAPKSWVISHPERSALQVARPFRSFATLFGPLIHLLNAMANGLVRLCGVQPRDDRAMGHSPTDLLLLLEESAGQGMIAPDESRLLARSLELSGLDAAAALTPRREMITVGADQPADDAARIAQRSGRTRLVVHDGDLDHVVGVLHAKDVLLLDADQRSTTTARDLARPGLVTHEGHLLEDLLVDMRSTHQHLAVVVDERGTVAGLVTLEDVLEELIGDFEDESDLRSRSLRQLDDGVYEATGDLRPDELTARTGIKLPDGEWDTLAGYVIARLDRVPAVGDRVTDPTATFEVTAMSGYAVETLEVTLRT